MAKKETSKAPAAEAAAASAQPATAANKAPKASKPATVDTFKFVKNVAEGEKLAPQARVIVNQLSNFKDGVTRDAFVESLKGKLQTRQPEGRILTYYQKLLVERGYIVIESSPVAAPATA